jgi:hypothetical protein
MPRSRRSYFDRNMTAPKSIVPQCGLIVSALLLVTGPMLLCDCPGWFVCGGLAAMLAAIWGHRLWRAVGICLCIASFAAAIMAFQHMPTGGAKRHNLRAGLMMLESCCQSFSSPVSSKDEVLSDLQHFAKQAQKV